MCKTNVIKRPFVGKNLYCCLYECKCDPSHCLLWREGKYTNVWGRMKRITIIFFKCFVIQYAIKNYWNMMLNLISYFSTMHSKIIFLISRWHQFNISKNCYINSKIQGSTLPLIKYNINSSSKLTKSQFISIKI